MEKIFNSVSLVEFIHRFSPEEVFKQYRPEEVLKQYSIEEIENYLEQVRRIEKRS